MALQVNEDGKKLGLRAGDARKLDDMFKLIALAQKGIEALKRCNIDGCEDRLEICASCLEQGEILKQQFFNEIA